jgi:DNA-binding SARP family transcriptional activator
MPSPATPSTAPTPRVQLFLLDGFRLEVDARPVEPSTCAQRLLALLALSGPRLRSAVAGTLWADVPEAHALGSLRTAMWRLNRCVPGIVTRMNSRLALADFVTIDVAHMLDDADYFLGSSQLRSHLVSSSWPETRETSFLRRSSGDLLPGWYEDWVLFERERFRQLRLHTLETAALRLAEGGQYAVALDLALEAVRSEPLRESAHRAVVRVHLAEGNVFEALRAYSEFATLLTEQLELEPSQQFANMVLSYISHATLERLRA